MSEDDHKTYTYFRFGDADYMIIKLPNKYRITIEDYETFNATLKSVSINIVHADIPHLNLYMTNPEATKDLPASLDKTGLLIIRFDDNGWFGNIFMIWSKIARLPSIDYLWVKDLEYIVTNKARIYILTM